MTNIQTRLVSSALGLVAGAILSTTSNVHVNVSIGVLIVCGTMFVTDYIRSQKP